MTREEYLQEIPLKFMVTLREDFENEIITEEEFNCYKEELNANVSIEYKYGLYISYFIMRR